MTELLGEGHPVLLAAFGVLALVAFVSAVAVVTRRNAVASIAWLVIHFVATAGAYILLDSQFIAAIQVLVYAGAIIVLFLFVVMLLSVDREADPGITGGIGRLTLAGALMLVLVAVFARAIASGEPPGTDGEAPAEENTVAWLARALFSEHLVAFEASSLPLLAAMAGVLVFTTRRVLVARSRQGAGEEASS